MAPERLGEKRQYIYIYIHIYIYIYIFVCVFACLCVLFCVLLFEGARFGAQLKGNHKETHDFAGPLYFDTYPYGHVTGDPLLDIIYMGIYIYIYMWAADNMIVSEALERENAFGRSRSFPVPLCWFTQQGIHVHKRRNLFRNP